MNHLIQRACLITVVFFFALISTTVFAQEENNDLYVRVDFMSVPEGGDELYLDVERAWSKWHSVMREEAGLVFWAVHKVDRLRGPESDYNYVTLNAYHDLNQMVSPTFNQERANQKMEALVTEKDNESFSKTGEARQLLRSDLWKLEDSAIPMSEEPAEPGNKTVTIGFMKSSQPGQHWAMERDIYKKIWQQAIKDGYRRNWNLLSAVFPSGAQSAYNLITTHSYPRDLTEYGLPSGWHEEKVPQLFPDKSKEEIRSIIDGSLANEVRSLPIIENWTIVLGLPEEEPGGVEGEWKKLEGKWKATQPNGGYRIKEISKGQEIIHYYNADGEKVSSLRSTMEIEQINGLNFFKVQGWTPLDDSNAPPADRAPYVSIYKVHNGKWYEQLRGVFSDNNNISPDQFLIYDKIE